MVTIKIKKGVFGACKVSDNAARVGKAGQVRWEGHGTAGCVTFLENDWPFQEKYQATIDVPKGQYGGPFTTVTGFPAELHAEYEYACKSCAKAIEEADAPSILGGGAKIIIN